MARWRHRDGTRQQCNDGSRLDRALADHPDWHSDDRTPPPEPGESAPKDAWVVYADSQGVDTDGLTKQQIIDVFRD